MQHKSGVICQLHTIMQVYNVSHSTRANNNMTTSVFQYKPLCVHLLDSVTACSWVGISSFFDCLLTGHKTGAIGFTWYPTPTSTEVPYSITLTYGSIKTVTHIATTTVHREVAIVDANGSLLLLRINGPREGIAKLATLTSAAVELVAGVAWSHSGSSLATLRYLHTGHTLSLRGYLALNTPTSQLSTVSVILPKSITGKELSADKTQDLQRLAWGRDDSELIVSLTNDTLIRVSAQTWQVTSQISLSFSPRITASVEGVVHALHSDGHLCIMWPDGHETAPTALPVSTYLWVPTRDMLITVIQHSNKQSVLFFNGEGREVSSFDVDTTSPVLDLCWREGGEGSSVVCSTEEGLYSLNVYSVVPSLKDLSIWSLVDSTKLPMRLQGEVMLRQSTLFYPTQLMDKIELEVNSYEKVTGLKGRRFLKIGKDYLGQQIHLFTLKQPRILYRNVFKLKSKLGSNEKTSGMLSKLLPAEIVYPASDTVITPQKNSSSYSLHRRNSSLQLTFVKNNKITLEREEGDVLTGDVKLEDNMKRTVSVEGEEIVQILGYSYYFQIVLSHNLTLPIYDTLLIALAFIVYAF